MTVDSSKKTTWFHGSPSKFDAWQVPPPQKDEFTAGHNALFFTSNLEFAMAAGKNVAEVSLTEQSIILDTERDYQNCEKLRLRLANLKFPSLLQNTQHDYWHAGWITGDVLRMAATDDAMAILNQKIQQGIASKGWPKDFSEKYVFHNATRIFIDQICVEAANIGFNVIVGNEVDRHTSPGRKVAQPWLAVMDKCAITQPTWLGD